MMIIFWIIVLSAFWSIVLVDDILHIPQNVKSGYILIDLLIKMLRCSLCTGYHLTWISWLILIGNGWGFIFGIITYWLVFLLNKYLFNVSI